VGLLEDYQINFTEATTSLISLPEISPPEDEQRLVRALKEKLKEEKAKAAAADAKIPFLPEVGRPRPPTIPPRVDWPWSNKSKARCLSTFQLETRTMLSPPYPVGTYSLFSFVGHLRLS
jgi:hypothetical protein